MTRVPMSDPLGLQAAAFDPENGGKWGPRAPGSLNKAYERSSPPKALARTSAHLPERVARGPAGHEDCEATAHAAPALVPLSAVKFRCAAQLLRQDASAPSTHLRGAEICMALQSHAMPGSSSFRTFGISSLSESSWAGTSVPLKTKRCASLCPKRRPAVPHCLAVLLEPCPCQSFPVEGHSRVEQASRFYCRHPSKLITVTPSVKAVLPKP